MGFASVTTGVTVCGRFTPSAIIVNKQYDLTQGVPGHGMMA